MTTIREVLDTVKTLEKITGETAAGTPCTANASDDIRIVVLQRGWVVVGRYSRSGDEVTINNASVVRVWGTTRGIGEIAAGGPTAMTILDPCPPVRVPRLGVVLTIDCDQAKWGDTCK